MTGPSGSSRAHLPNASLNAPGLSRGLRSAPGCLPEPDRRPCLPLLSRLASGPGDLLARPLSWSFSPLQRLKRGQRPTPGLPHPAVQRPRPFSDPRRLAPPRKRSDNRPCGCLPVCLRYVLSALFHADDAHGVPPPEVSPPRGPLGLPTSLPLSTFADRHRGASATASILTRPPKKPGCPALRGSGTTGNPFFRSGGVSHLTGADPLLGFQLSRVFAPAALAPPSGPLLPCPSSRRSPKQSSGRDSGVFRCRRIGWPLARLPTLLRFSVLVPRRPEEPPPPPMSRACSA
jgi:hypothetical protein